MRSGYEGFWDIGLYKEILYLNEFKSLYSLERLKTILIQFREDFLCDIHNLPSRDIRALNTCSRDIFALEYIKYYLLTKVKTQFTIIKNLFVY